MENTNCNLCGSNESFLLLKIQERHFKKDTFNIVQCKKCSLIYTNPRPRQEEIGKYYYEEYYACKFSYPPAYFPSESKISRKIKNFLKKKVLAIHYGYFSNSEKKSFKNNFLKFVTLPFKYRIGSILPPYKSSGKVLDVGCATGHYLSVLRELGWETYGVEMDEKAALWAKEKLGLNVFADKFEEIVLPLNYFDVITLRHTLEHFFDPSSVLKKVHQILKPNGLVIISIPNADTWEARFFGRWWWGWDVPRHLFHFSSKSIINLLKKEGFKTIRIEYTPDVLNIVFSLHDFLLNRFPQKEIWIKQFFNQDENSQLCSFLMPLGYCLALIKQIGRIVVYGQK